MSERFIVFDVETPNRNNDRISSIGIAVIDGGVITENHSYLVNPETDFDYFNISLTGITPESVENAPNFHELWRRIGPLMQSGILVAHNAQFDMSVLAKCLDSYEEDIPQYMQYICTYSAGRAFMPELPNHKLDTICDYLGISLSHHDSGSDAMACAMILLTYLSFGCDIIGRTKTYDMYNRRTLR